MDTETSSAEHEGEREPRRVRLPGFLMESDEVGLGDVIRRATSAVGVRPCSGCGRRAQRLNSWVVFARRQ